MAKEKTRLKLGLPFDYRTRALVEGEVGIEGYDLDIIHLIAMKEEVAEKHPDLPAKLIATFRAAKELGIKKYMTPEQLAGYEKEKGVLGEDPYAHVLGETEKRTMRALNRYQIEQGLMKSELPLEGVFVREAFA